VHCHRYSTVIRGCALPRLSINGNLQSLEMLEILVSGAPFALWNLGRLVA
jgi:hypothetical protein